MTKWNDEKREEQEKIERVADKTNNLNKAYERLGQELKTCKKIMDKLVKEVKAAYKEEKE